VKKDYQTEDEISGWMHGRGVDLNVSSACVAVSFRVGVGRIQA
jgi:hypothetical protein